MHPRDTMIDDWNAGTDTEWDLPGAEHETCLASDGGAGSRVAQAREFLAQPGRLQEALGRLWEKRDGMDLFGKAKRRLIPSDWGEKRWDGTEEEVSLLIDEGCLPELEESKPTATVPSGHPDRALDHARVLLRDPRKLQEALFMAWGMKGGGAVEARRLATEGRLPHGTGVWDGSDEQIRYLLDHACIAEPKPATVVAPSPAFSPPERPVVQDTVTLKTAPASESAKAPATSPARATTPAWAWDRVPKAITRDRHLSAQAVRLYLLLLDVSNNTTKIAIVSQATLARWMGLKSGGRNRVAVWLAKLEERGFVERLLRGRRLGQQGEASRYRVHCGALPLAREDDLRGEGIQ